MAPQLSCMPLRYAIRKTDMINAENVYAVRTGIEVLSLYKWLYNVNLELLRNKEICFLFQWEGVSIGYYRVISTMEYPV